MDLNFLVVKCLGVEMYGVNMYGHFRKQLQ